MKRTVTAILTLVLLLNLLIPAASATGDGNVEGGGGGMGQGTSQNKWSSGDDGVRVTIVRAEDGIPVTAPIDLTNKRPSIAVHFGKVSKLSYKQGTSLASTTNAYQYINPGRALPRIISTSAGSSNIDAIKSYFTDEQVIRSIAGLTGMDFDALTGGEYKMILEPIAFITFGGVKYALSATEAALYDKQLSGGLRAKMQSLSHKNLPLAMFLERPDLGYTAWSGSTSSVASNETIISYLGIGIVSFTDTPPEDNDPDDPPEPQTQTPSPSGDDYDYRINTDVITSVVVSGGQSDPDNPVSVSFTILGTTYNVSNVYYPEGGSQLAWVRWRTPSTSRTTTITVTASGGATVSWDSMTVRIGNLAGKDPPNPTANDRNSSFSPVSIPYKTQRVNATWGVWRPWWQENWVWVSVWNWCSHSTWVSTGPSAGYWDTWGHWVDNGYWEDQGWWEFGYDSYYASMSAGISIIPDAKNPTAIGETIKSGYGINQSVTANVSTNQSSATTDAQNAVTYFPEFRYRNYWRLLERISGGYSSRFEFKPNKYSTYNNRTHFTPIWYPDGSYTPYTWLLDCWTPAGMLSVNLTDSVTISDNLFSDWHIAPMKPD